MCRVPVVFLEDAWGIRLQYRQVHKPFSISMSLYISHGLTFSNGVSSTDTSRSWTLVATGHSCFSSHRSWDANWFCKQYAIALAFLFWWYVIPKASWTTVDAVDQAVSRWLPAAAARVRARVWSIGICCGQSGTGAGTIGQLVADVPSGPSLDSTHPLCELKWIGHRAWGVTSQFSIFVSRRSNAFLRIIRLTILATELTAVLRAGSRVTCHRFLNLRLCFSRLSSSGGSLFMSESIIFIASP
jgi:hypothetical protein